MYCDHALVGEVIVINNSDSPLPFEHLKMNEVRLERNIYVNPSWNLGVSIARYPMLIISNDDIQFTSSVIDTAAKVLEGTVGIVGPHARSFARRRTRLPWVTPAYSRTNGFGTLMFLRADRWSPIPDDMKILCGDDWLFHHQIHRNCHLRGVAIKTEMATTSGSPEFALIRQQDKAIYCELRPSAYAEKFWLGTRASAVAMRIRRSLSPVRRALRRVSVRTRISR